MAPRKIAPGPPSSSRASLPFERFGESGAHPRPDAWPAWVAWLRSRSLTWVGQVRGGQKARLGKALSRCAHTSLCAQAPLAFVPPAETVEKPLGFTHTALVGFQDCPSSGRCPPRVVQGFRVAPAPRAGDGCLGGNREQSAGMCHLDAQMSHTRTVVAEVFTTSGRCVLPGARTGAPASHTSRPHPADSRGKPPARTADRPAEQRHRSRPATPSSDPLYYPEGRHPAVAFPVEEAHLRALRRPTRATTTTRSRPTVRSCASRTTCASTRPPERSRCTPTCTGGATATRSRASSATRCRSGHGRWRRWSSGGTAGTVRDGGDST